MKNVPNKSSEEYENVIPWFFTGILNSKMDTKDVVKAIARDGDNEKETLFDICVSAFKQGKDIFFESSDYMKIISELPYIKKFEEARNKWVAKFYKNVPKDEQKNNIIQLRLYDWKIFLICCYDIVTICFKIHKGSINIDRLRVVGNTYFKLATEKVNNNDLEKVISTNTGLTARYDKFLLDVREKTIAERANSNGFDINLISDKCIEDIEQRYSTKNFEFYDRQSSKNFPIKTLDISGGKKNWEEGHLDGSDIKKYGNIVIQPKLDNKYNNNKPIDDIDVYIKEYLKQLKLCLGNDLDHIIFDRTKILLNSWKNQILIK